MATATHFSRTLALLRKEQGISQRAAAQDLGVSQALLSHYENGVREPGLAFVMKVCDYYHVSADFLLGRTLARDGNMLTPEEILNLSEPGNVLKGSILATLQKKLISGAVNVLFGLLGKLNNKDAINAAAACLGDTIYRLYRQFYRAAGADENLFALPADDCGLTDADLKLEERRYARALQAARDAKTAFPDIAPKALAEEYPGINQSLTQVLSAADQRVSHWTEC